MITKVLYVIVKIKVSVDEDKSIDEIEEIIGEDCDYEIAYNDNGILITDTELLSVSTDFPL